MRRTLRAVKLLARQGRIPRPLRVLAGFGLLPIPGPVDEAVLLLVALLLWLFYRDVLADAWRRSDEHGRAEGADEREARRRAGQA